MFAKRLAGSATALGLIWGGMALAEEAPLSVIDWLSDSVAAPAVPAAVAPMADSAAPQDVTVSPLDGPRLDAVGLLSPGMAGLTPDLWHHSAASDIARLLRSERADVLPSVQALLYTLLLAELDPPGTSDEADGVVLLARLDKLLEMGALDQAQALLERAGPTEPSLFRRWFDVSLLTGHEDRACAAMRAAPAIAPTFQSRIFCLARGGDWNAAALSLETGGALGHVSDEDFALMARFLDPELTEEDYPLTMPTRPSPLVFRMFEAIGEPLPTTGLPLAFAQADLRNTSGWKSRVEAAERLARSGAISPNRLLGIYTERRPAASGGIWDRVAAVQALDVAVLSGEPDQIAAALPPAWEVMQRSELEVPFAEIYGERLASMGLTGKSGQIALRLGLLSGAYETVARAAGGDAPAMMVAIATGGSVTGGATQLERAIASAFATPRVTPAMQARLNEGRSGEALLEALRLITDGARGDVSDISEGLSLLRLLGLEDTARRAALELLILERRG
ncbi:hypothetical protein [Actibacterium sp. XHP0104]|uniref:hypothetical protein n=1 Tax=Actibacterium sp. XHP0104 TaxID=2984335 RepID=UPI0021E9A066|nr:hypothetical protein [Actibacterium sp. XHP0104]MCV2881149.1 hypothetical protein [Actibacterium sp. XHP0104]